MFIVPFTVSCFYSYYIIRKRIVVNQMLEAPVIKPSLIRNTTELYYGGATTRFGARDLGI